MLASQVPRELPKGQFYRMAVDSSPLRWWRTWADPAALEVGSGAEGEAGVVVVGTVGPTKRVIDLGARAPGLD